MKSGWSSGLIIKSKESDEKRREMLAKDVMNFRNHATQQVALAGKEKDEWNKKETEVKKKKGIENENALLFSSLFLFLVYFFFLLFCYLLYILLFFYVFIY